MSTSDNSNSLGLGSSSFAFGAALPDSQNVASLDSPSLKATKSEIRKLAAEVAELANSDIPPAAFYDGFLAKVTMAMGGSGAAVWKATAGDPTALGLDLRAHYNLRPELLEDTAKPTAPSQDHSTILQCVAREKQPILIPPSAVTIDAERPSNPIDESLVVVPVILEGRVECLLEVVQRACGGPAAQRGYLRFVAQMADLLADYLRRKLLREYSENAARIQNTENWILDCVTAEQPDEKYRCIVDGLRDSLSAQQALLVRYTSWIGTSPKVLAMSHVQGFDPKSEIAECIGALHSALKASVKRSRQRSDSLPAKTPEADPEAPPMHWYVASNRREADAQESRQENAAVTPRRQRLTQNQQNQVDRLCDLLRCRSFIEVRLVEPSKTDVILTLDTVSTQQALQTGLDSLELANERGQQLLEACRGLLTNAQQRGISFQQTTGLLSGGTGRVAGRVAIAAVILLAAFIPVPLQIRATAVLQPVNKYAYYAPMQSFVEEIHVEEGTDVEDQQPLLNLRSRKLESEIESLFGEREGTNDRIAELVNRLSRDNTLGVRDQDQIEAELAQLRTKENTLGEQLKVLSETRKDLAIVALGNGKVSTWDLRNRLLNRPVEAGKLLVSTYDPKGPWRLQVSIPNSRIGTVVAAIQDEELGAKVRFSLVSQPEPALEARLKRLASQVVQGQDGTHVLHGFATLDASQLPLRQDGAIANAVIDCGTTPAIGLVFRDAYWAVRSQINLYW